MPITMTDFTPSTVIKSAEVDSNFTSLASAINNLRPTIFWYVAGTLAVDTNVTAELKLQSGQTLTFDSVDLSVKTAPTGADLIIDINKNGTTIFSTRPQIAAGETSGGGSAAFSATTITDGDVLTVDVDQVGSTVAGASLTIGLGMKI